MAKKRIGLMGFGRIGRNVFRQLSDHPDLEVAAIADIADPAALAYLLEFDTIFGRFPKPLELTDDGLVMDGRTIPMLNAPDPGDADWGAHGVDIVVQATRKHRTAAECGKHLDAGASRVILASTPENPGEIDLLISGVNDEVFDPSDRIIALGSNTSNALGPVLKLLDDRFGVDRALFTVVHAFTNEQRLADVPGTELRTSRAAAENIIPTATDSASIIEMVMPEMKGKLAGIALNVPVPDGSNVDLVAFLERSTDVDEVNAAIAEAAKGSEIIEYTYDPIVSSDVIGSTYSAIWDGQAAMVLGGDMLKAVIWFDNGWGYSARAVDVMEKIIGWDGESA
jgi:glyceraldehyde 3-phosphate dehydrogenase